MAAGSTYTPIATATATGGVTEIITFSSISGSYTDLILIANTGPMPEITAFRFRFNSDAGSNYSYLQASTLGSNAATTQDANQVSGLVSGSLMNTTDRSMFVINILNYSNSSTYKTTINTGSRADSTNLAALSMCVSTWHSTSPITTVSISGGFGGGVYIPNGSTFTLYGIAAA